ncbi:MAG: DEAD/DEAH box helicase family protein [Gammaproteobacteria bacterium]|nr:DEAD/DEAH box helicase family protein [Gammaproteobacteria bacterium]
MSLLKFKFDGNLDYQRQAIDSVINLFEGQPLAKETYSIALGQEAGGSQLVMGDESFGNVSAMANQLVLSDELLLENMHKVQETNNVPKQAELAGRHFSIEMETGTGKTYVYLRSIFELNKKYGFTKFIIVVPSVAIREGVQKSIQMTRDHFKELYDQTPFNAFVYDAKKPGQVRTFAGANALQIMIINIQAFDKATAILNQDREQGRLINFIRATKPILLIDEPQSVEGDTRKEQTKRSQALDSLNPLCTLRYSATHKNPYNLLYVLNPIDAYDLRLVKRIEVASLVEDQSFNTTFVALKSVDNKKGIKAKLQINVGEKGGPRKKAVTVKQGDDLYLKAKERQEYQSGWVVANISCEPGIEHVEFSNGQVVKLGEALGGLGDELMRAQVYETVEQHLKKEQAVKGKGIKVLSLFFIDKVANYRIYNDDGSTTLGKVGQWFEEAYQELRNKPLYKGLLNFDVEKVHNGYFSQDKKGIVKDTTGKAQADEQTYALIMREKEQLLSLEEPLRFIFSHSALKEGWDNPNVFQICTLNETKSQDRKRQEIGRGLRLPVNQQGERVSDPSVNRLTVVANESYEDFARQLQNEFEEDYGLEFGKVDVTTFAKLINSEAEQYSPLGQDVSKELFSSLVADGYIDESGKILDKFDPKNPHFVLALPDEWAHMRPQIVDEMNRYVFKNRVVNARDRRTLNLRKNIFLDPTFRELWQRISQRTRYRVTFDTEELVKSAAQAIHEMPPIYKTRITTELYSQSMSHAGIEGQQISGGVREVAAAPQLPDLLAYLQNSTELTRHTLVRILKQSERLADFIRNPQIFINQVTDCMQRELHGVTVKGIQYEKIGGAVYEMHQIEEENGITRYLNNLYEVQNIEKTLYDYVEYDSDVEKEFAKSCDSDERVKFYCKLPPQFKVDTPVGPYNPDWALVTEGEEKLYLIRETKSTRNEAELRDKERDKITCGRRHFEAIGVDYEVVTTLDEALNG